MPFDPTTAKPVSSVFDPTTAKPVDEPQSFAGNVLSGAGKTVASIPGDIAEKFTEGGKTGLEGLSDIKESVTGGLNPDVAKGKFFLGAVKLAGGGFAQILSPISGTVKAIAADPISAPIPPGVIHDTVNGVVQIVGDVTGPQAAASALTKIATFLPKLSDSVKALMSEGVRLTPGHMGGRVVKGLEDRLTSTPVAGEFIDNAQRRAVEDFNRATVNKSIKTIGGQTAGEDVKAGTDLISFAQREHGRMWDQVEKSLTWTLDKPLATSLQTAVLRDIRMTGADQARLDEIVGDVMQRLKAPGADASVFKGIRSDIDRIAGDYIKKDEISERTLGYKLQGLVDDMWASLERQNPQQAGPLRDLRLGWAMFKRAEGASVRRKTAGGVFMPSDLLQDIGKNSTQSAFARGDGLLQKWAQDGQNVLPQLYGRSGTAERNLWIALTGVAAMDPAMVKEVAGGIAAGSALYSRPSVSGINALVKGAPSAGRTATDLLSRSGPAAAGADILSQGDVPQAP